MKNEILKIIASVIGSSMMMFCFYMSIFVSKMALDGKYLLFGFLVVLHFLLSLLLYVILSAYK